MPYFYLFVTCPICGFGAAKNRFLLFRQHGTRMIRCPQCKKVSKWNDTTRESREVITNQKELMWKA
jgi:endogenous inhibitor of DNA gyrase (YacG/DUF329 family)